MRYYDGAPTRDSNSEYTQANGTGMRAVFGKAGFWLDGVCLI